MGFVVNFTRFLAVKKCEDKLAFDKVRATIKGARFYGPPCSRRVFLLIILLRCVNLTVLVHCKPGTNRDAVSVSRHIFVTSRSREIEVRSRSRLVLKVKCLSLFSRPTSCLQATLHYFFQIFFHLSQQLIVSNFD